jgi:uncharacterized protein YbaP (TraB family)
MFLFSFTKNQKTSYLLGTLHTVNYDLLNKKVQGFLLSRNALIVESIAPKKIEKNLEIIKLIGGFKEATDGTNVFENFDSNTRDLIIRNLEKYIAQGEFLFKVQDLSLKGIAVLA